MPSFPGAGRTRHHSAPSRPRRQAARGQVIIIAALAMVALIGGVALVLEAGNAYAHQRITQNGADAIANGGATVLAEQLGGTTGITDASVLARMTTVAAANGIPTQHGWYTDVAGHLLTTAGVTTTSTATAAPVGGGTIPPNTQGVQVESSQPFGTTFGRVIGLTQFTSTADATSVTGALTGGQFLPVVFPVNIVDCEQNGDLGVGEVDWTLSEPGHPPVGQEYIVPLCKTGGGSFMILDLDGTPNNCDDEVLHPPAIQFDTFPVDIASDNGNNCAKKMVDEVNALHGKVVLIPICDGQCVTAGGSHATYHIIRVAAFYLDYMSDENPGGGKHNSACQGNGTSLVPIRGNGSDSCVAGWFVRYITSGPVGSGNVQGAGAIGIQLVK
jgi:hypothetical protein